MLAFSPRARAQNVQENPKETNKMVLTATRDGNLVTFTWPKMIHFTELQQQVIQTNIGRWIAVPDSLYVTNKGVISVALPVSNNTTYFRVFRFGFIEKPANFRKVRNTMPAPPSLPPATNKPAGKRLMKALPAPNQN